MQTITMAPTETKLMARHALRCRGCMVKAKRLLEKPPHLERMELLCAIEWCHVRASGRKAHA